MKLFDRIKNRIFLAMMPSQVSVAEPFLRKAITESPELAESILRSNDVLWATVMQTAMMHKLGDLDANGNAEARNTQQYPILNRLGYANNHGARQTMPKVSPFNLRQFSEYTPVRRAINAITAPILDMPWSIEIMRPHGQRQKADDLTLKEQMQIKIATNVLQNPNHEDSWRNLLWQTVEDILVGSFGSIEVQRTDDVFRPVVLYPVDGSSIRINIHWRGGDNKPHYAQNVGFLGHQFAEQNEVQLLDEELLYFRMQPRTNTPFGIGYVETAYQNINAWVGAFEFAERRASNSTPNYALFLGEHIDPATARVWRQYWENEVEGYGKIPIIGGGQSPQVLSFAQGSEDELWLKWQELLIRYVAQAFNLSASTFALERDINRSTATQLDADDWGAVAPVAYTISDLITHKLLHQIMGFRNLRFKWVIRDTDEKRQSEILEQRFKMNSITPNEIREHYDQNPLDGNVGNLVLTQLKAIEDSLPALAPGMRKQQDEGGKFPPDEETKEESKENASDSDYVIDRLSNLIQRMAKKQSGE